ncbi:hypothetical protein BGW80DRAFT_1170019 [Lactifluus volemus]|nr:hypothetical protein BGW80DRAFT_1170019 [Lactifluus volemus]
MNQLPCASPPDAKESLLAKHAHGLLEESRRVIHRLPGGHRYEAAQYELLLESEPAVIVLGHACAYSASRRAKFPRRCLTCTSAPPFVATQRGSLQRANEGSVLREAAPNNEKYLGDLDIKYAVRASIISDENWLDQVQRMRCPCDVFLVLSFS